MLTQYGRRGPSRKPVTRSSSRSTTPRCETSGATAIVAAAPDSRWRASIAARSTSRSSSPLSAYSGPVSCAQPRREPQPAAAAEPLGLLREHDLGAEPVQRLVERRSPVPRRSSRSRASRPRRRAARPGTRRADARRPGRAPWPACAASPSRSALPPARMIASTGGRAPRPGRRPRAAPARPSRARSPRRRSRRRGPGADRACCARRSSSGRRIEARTSSRTIACSSGHSVTITAASAPRIASNGVRHSSTARGSTGAASATGSQPRTWAPSATRRFAITIDGASRMSSVFGLNARPEQRDRRPPQRPEVAARASPTTRRFCSSFTSITAVRSWKW